MNKLYRFIIVPVALAVCSTITQLLPATAQTVEINSKLQADPLIIKGTSGGKQRTNCGYVSAQPSKKIKLTQSLPYLRLTVEGNGQPTLLIDGPGGRFCVLADKFSTDNPEISGYWNKGEYLLYIGEPSQAQYTYTLSISQQRKPKSSGNKFFKAQ
ncbi:MAG: hypothetical protein AAF208_07740 [Cyanobacteria bacterium P01_A01_bin.45]